MFNQLPEPSSARLFTFFCHALSAAAVLAFVWYMIVLIFSVSLDPQP